MPYLVEKPTENDFAGGRALIWTGTLLFFGALAFAASLRIIFGLPLTALWQHVLNASFGVMSFGLGAISWGLRVYARDSEYRSAARQRGTPAYEAACTMIAILFFLAPIVAGLIAFDVISLPTFPDSGRGR